MKDTNKVVVTHKSYINPSTNMVLKLVFDDGRTILVQPMRISSRLRIFNGIVPTITWEQK